MDRSKILVQAGCIKPVRPPCRRSHQPEISAGPPAEFSCSIRREETHLRPAAGRPRVLLPGWLDDSGRLQTHEQLDEVLLRAAAAGDSTASDVLGENLLRFLQRRNPDSLRLLLPPEEEMSEHEAAVREQLLKRSEEPPLSIDLTFHLLRNMIQMAKMESQREQAQLNRRVLDEVGK
ncbi:UI Urophysin [Collichthys lucidus]|uniref:UI Urophysin n=1 Tax=Collichthys lucidus TaxID=240159 RepID=A0A4U5UKR1_COLLU|nr:UI Urophysin [Collichthys lucidus]